MILPSARVIAPLLVCVLIKATLICSSDEFLSVISGTKVSIEDFVKALEGSYVLDDATIESQIRLTLYTGSSIETGKNTSFPLQDVAKIYESIDRSKPVVLYIHGYMEHPSNESIRTVVGAHLQRGNDNIILADWSDLAYGNYIIVAAMTRNIGRSLARTFDGLVALGLDPETFHCVGHSLGAQVSGFLGKFSRNTVPRITGLDPAFPLFYHPGAEHVNAESARFVDVVHTDGGLYGVHQPTGTVDFYPNGGTRPQPGCPLFGIPLIPNDLCNHWASWRYYAESVIEELAFPAVECPSYPQFLMGKCNENQRVYFGYATSKDARGSFYFSTKDKPPFGKGYHAHLSNHLRK